MYRRILIPTDCSEASAQAAEYGFELAGFHGAAVTLVSVLETTSVYPAPMGGFAFTPLYPDLIEETEKATKEQQARGKRLGLQVDIVLRQGDPAMEIVEVAKQVEADLILMAAHSHGRIASLLLGSVSQAILRQAPCPVLVYGEEARQKVPALQGASAFQQTSESERKLDPEC